MKDRFMKNGIFSLEYDKETLRDMVLELQEENKNQKEVIDKAIKYIKSYKTDYSPYELSDYNIRQILDILKKEDH